MLEHMRVFRLTTCLLALATGASLPIGAAAAAPLQPAAIHWDAATSSDLIEVRAAVRRGGAAMGPRGGAVVHRGGAVVGPRGAAYRGGTVVRGPRGNVAVRRTTAVAGRGGWARPGWYGWPRGGAIAAGAAIGFVTAATAAAWAGAAPAPGMCWYYTDPSRTQGFWDYCQ
ncbi:hypothetical protein ABIB94_006036 [Bradyrhizobium sp. JR7.2]|uniref:Uncharacterized protein n=1 Tax=Bradyrhizobium barranii TaxID=2992140 RepID=A0ABY3QAV3_9BRAD|nr:MULTISPECIES: hypothetical protein [Bradyrhizobium]UFW82903.1 hypothetical protein BjapCC829_23225 [Bradyrhizobium japonicum]WFT91324.1 hypothetical protein QA633_23435 [Bradyrhizobium barranii]